MGRILFVLIGLLGAGAVSAYAHGPASPSRGGAEQGTLNTAGKLYKYWVEFTDKNKSPYSIDRPGEFLSERAVQRRKKQNIPVTVQDIPVNSEYILGVTRHGAKVLNRSRWFNAITVQMDDTSRLVHIKALPFVKKVSLLGYFDRNYEPMRDLSIFGIPSEDYSDILPDNYYGAGFRQIDMLNGVNMHKLGFKGEGMLIAILDAGFEKGNMISAFDSIRLNGHIKYAYDFVEGNMDVYDDDDHGLSVFSCMASHMPYRMVGTAPNADYLLLRTEDDGSEFPVEETNWVAAAEFADSTGADIINSSLGYNYTEESDHRFALKYDQLDGKTAIASRAAFIAASKGILVVNAAGNEGDKPWHYIGVPADAENIITVGAVDSRKLHAYFSSYGPTSDGRIKPTVSAMGEKAMVISPRNTVYQANGTSFSAPVLCGLVACLWQACPDKSYQEVMEAIMQSGDRYANPDNAYGYGIPDFMVALTILGGNKQFNYKADQWVEEPKISSRSFSYHFYSVTDQSAELVITGAKDKQVYSGKINLKAGFNKSILATGKLPKGRFTLKFTTASGTTFSKEIEI